MKSYIDFFETFKGEFLSSLKFKNKFIRYWGTETIDGVQVLKKRFILYPGYEKQSVKNLLKLIGADKQFNSKSFKNVKKYYLYLNPSKADTLNQENLDLIIASKINNYCQIDEELIVNLNFTLEDKTSDYFKNFTKQMILDYLVADYDNMYNLLDNYTVGDTLLIHTIGSYILFDDNQHFEINVLKTGISSIPYQKKISTYDNDSDEYITAYRTGISIQFSAKRKSMVNSNSKIVNHIKDETDEAKKTRLQQLIESENNESISDDYIWIKQREEKTDDVWYKGRFRVGFLNDKNGIKTIEKSKILISAIDTGYTLPKTKWWKKILGPVLIVIAIVVTVLSGGTLGPAAFAMSLAANVGIAVLVMTGLQIYFAKHGDPAAAQYMGRWIVIGQIISVATGIYALIANLSRQAAVQAATKAATESATQASLQSGANAVSNIAVSSNGVSITATSVATVTETGTAISTTITEGIISGSQVLNVGFSQYLSTAFEMFTSSVTTGWQSITSNAMKLIKFISDTRYKMKAQNLQTENNARQEMLDKTNEDLEAINDREFNIGVEDIKWYTDDLRSDRSIYDVDYLYGGTKHNILRPSFYPVRGLNIISNDIYDITKI